ncbi:GrpB family protein [Candidatus Riflebacteria bacterium]
MGTYSLLNRPIVIEDYDRSWPLLFEVEREMLCRHATIPFLQIEHIGSTSIPGLAAKPIIDIALGIENLSNAKIYFSFLKELGYLYVPEFEIQLPDRRFFWKGSQMKHTHHLHMCEPQGPTWTDPIIFRDFLRKNPKLALDYAGLKKELARKFPTDLDEYIIGKSNFVSTVLQLAADISDR